MRNIDSSEITKNIKEMCIEANHFLAPDMERVFKKAKENEESKLGCQILEQLDENLKIAAEDMIPICQDTGMAVVFIEIGQDIHIEGENLEDAINEGVRQGYVDGYLRKSVVSDPIIRENTKDNTPAVIHYSIVPGENIKITVAPKGFGSENMSKVFMLKPADGIEGVKDAVLTAVKEAGPNACPPMVVGVGIGGTFEKCAILAKKALARPADSNSEIPYVKVNGDRVKRLPNNVNVSFQFVEGESLLIKLDMKGICASSGSACTSGSLDPSHVLLAIGLPHEIAHGSLRMTLSEETTMEDVDFVVDRLKEIVAHLRSMSPLYEDFVKKHK